ncbi:hypothetical protein Hte_004917 [Hypoxylon texense]
MAPEEKQHPKSPSGSESSTTAPSLLLPTSPIPTSIQPSDAGGTPHRTLQGRLWNEAYDNLKDEQSELVDAYERFLSRELGNENLGSTDEGPGANNIDQREPERRQVQFDQLLQVGLEKTKKSAVVMQNIQGGVELVHSVKGWVDEAVKSVPQTALPWTGVCFILENELVLELDASPRGEFKWQIRGIEESQLEDQIMDLYKSLLSYQMKSICSYYRKRFTVILRDVISLDDWKGALESIQDAESTVQKDIDTFANFEIKQYLGELVKNATSMHSDIYRAIQDQTVSQNEMRQKEKDNECLAALRLTDPRHDKTRIIETKGGLHRDSSNWILEHEDFRRWRDDDEARILWIKGDPGKGKTMLLIAIVVPRYKLTV